MGIAFACLNLLQNPPKMEIGTREPNWQLANLAMAIGDGNPTLAAENRLSLRRQEFMFAFLNLVLIGSMLIMEVISRIVRGKPPLAVILILLGGAVIQAVYLVWLRGNWPLSGSPRLLTFWAIGFNTALTLLLTAITLRHDTVYYALMLLPILEAAFRLSLRATIAMIAVAVLIAFTAALGLRFGEYIEVGAISVIYSIMGVLVWHLVNNLRDRQARFLRNLEELEHTRHRLSSEEKLAAIGRLSRALAHEIRNPVAMISSSLATVTRPGQDDADREEMFAIAAKEASRLERLTTDFLLYARPRAAQLEAGNLADTLNYVAAVARAHAANEGVDIDVSVDGELEGEFDSNQIQQALLNLVLNAIDACDDGDAVSLNAHRNRNGLIRIDVVDPAGPIPSETVERIFEPLFTTKPGGNGLGLAIARNIARAHGGDLVLGINEPGRVCFSLEIPAHTSQPPA